MHFSHKNNRIQEPYWYLAPALIVTFGVLVFPLIYAGILSLLRWDLTRPDLGISFVGIHNYIRSILSKLFRESFLFTLFFAIALVTAELIIGFAVALMLQCKIWGRGVFRSLILLPMVITPVVAGLIFRSLLFNTTFGIINYFLSLLGISPLGWLASVGTARFCVFVTSLWIEMPFAILLLLAGLESLPVELYEAAAIDGATPKQSFWFITVPLIRPTIIVAVIFMTIFSLRLFDIPWIVTAGGPGTSTQTLSILAYKQSMLFFRMGTGASMAMIILLITAIFAIAYIKMIKREPIKN